MSITQLNATYVPEEDRVQFRFTTSTSEEYRLWLSRAVVRNLLNLGEQASVAVLAREHPPAQARAIAEFKQQATVENAQFTTFVPATTLPMGEQAILVQQVKLVLHADVTELEMALAGGKVMKVKLNAHMVGQLRLLLQTIAQRANWDLGATANPPPASAEPEAPRAKTLH